MTCLCAQIQLSFAELPAASHQVYVDSYLTKTKISTIDSDGTKALREGTALNG